MDNGPIGIFDSGVGGLTAVKALRRLLPGENILYFGDSGRMPYGTRAKEEIERMAYEDAALLVKRGAKALLAACNTIDSNALPALQARFAQPVFGVIGPAAQKAARTTKTGRVGVIATEATAKSDAYGTALRALLPEASVTTVGCPTLATLVEQGHTKAGDPVLDAALEEYLAPIREAGADTLILGCTHYPLLTEAIGAILGGGVALVDSGAAGAEALAAWLCDSGMTAGRPSGSALYCTSGNLEPFSRVAGVFLEADVSGCTCRIQHFGESIE